MPGYVIHLAMAKRIIEKKNITDERFINNFLIGSIAPDAVKKEEKVLSHFWAEDELKKLVRKPDLDNFITKHCNYTEDAYWYGYYCHLLLDYEFVTNYWKKHFRFFNDSMEEEWRFDYVTKVLVVETGITYQRDEFFSSVYYYGDYTRMNPYIMKKYNIIIPTLDKNLGDAGTLGDTLDELSRMISFLHLENNKTVMEKPVVFNLSEIEDLIEKSSEKLC